MEEKKVSLIQSSVNSGVMLGLILVVYSVILFIANLWLNPWLGFVSFAILIGGIIYATKVYRTSLGGFISYKDAFLVGLLTVGIASAITAIYSFLFFTVINPDAMSQIADYSMEMTESMMEKFGASDDVMEEALEKAREEIEGQTATGTVIKGFFSSAIGGAIISLITAAVMKKKQDMAEF